jgi:hypothetical protein
VEPGTLLAGYQAPSVIPPPVSMSGLYQGEQREEAWVFRVPQGTLCHVLSDLWIPMQ